MLLIAPLTARWPVFRSVPAPDAAALPPDPSAGASSRAKGFSSARRALWPVGQDLFVFFYLGLFGVAVNQLCFTIGLQYTNVTHSSIIVGLAPIYTLTLAVLFRLEPLTWRKALGMAIAFSGIVALASAAGIPNHSPTLLGDAVTMCGSIGFAMYVVLGKRVAAKHDALTMTTWNF